MRILIVGGGIAGLSSAIALRQKGFSPEVIERAADWRIEGAGLHLPGNAVAPLQRLGLWAAVEAVAFPFPRILYCDPQDRPLFELPLESGGWPCFQALARADFHRLLVEALGDTPVRFETEIKSLETNGGAASVAFSDGEQAAYDLVIGADGINSATRRLLFGEACVPLPTGFSCWRWMTALPEGYDAPHFMLGGGTVFLVMPTGKERAYVFACSHGGAPEGNSEQSLRRLFADFGGPVPSILARLEEDGPILPAPLQQMILPNWTDGPVALVGDAAHGTLPTLAQGATQAMEDALALAEQLVAQPGNIPAALKAYEQQRLPRAHWVQRQSLRRMGLAKLKAGPLVALRNALMRRAGPKILASGWRPLISQ